MQTNKNASETRLGTEPINKLMLSMGIPTLIAQLINLLYNIVDRIYIGQGVGREALTGVGLTLPDYYTDLRIQLFCRSRSRSPCHHSFRKK